MHSDWYWYVLLIAAGFIAGVVNTIAGGGSFLTLPVLMAVGLPPQVANGSNRVAILLQSGLSGALFRREGLVNGAKVLRFGVPSLLGVIVGVWIGAVLPEDVFKDAFGVIFLGMTVVFIFKPKLLLKADKQAALASLSGAEKDESLGTKPWVMRRLLEAVGFFLLGVYGGFIQAGAGVLLLMLMALLSTDRLVASNGIKLVLIMMWQVVAIVGYAWAGQIDWVAGLVLAAGNVPGAIVGTRLAIKKGDKLIFAVLVVVMVATGLKLLLT